MLDCRHKEQAEESFARSDEQLLKTDQGVTYRAKVKVMWIAHAQSGKNGPGFRDCTTNLPLPRQYVPVENGSHK